MVQGCPSCEIKTKPLYDTKFKPPRGGAASSENQLPRLIETVEHGRVTKPIKQKEPSLVAMFTGQRIKPSRGYTKDPENCDAESVVGDS